MKKKWILITIPIIILVLVVGYLLWNQNNERSIYLDINPSIKIILNNDDSVKDIVILSEEKNLKKEEIKRETLKDTIGRLVDKLIDLGIPEENSIRVLCYTKGNIQHDEIGDKLTTLFEEKDITVHLTFIEKITKEDKKLAKKYHISISKAAFINQIVKENNSLPVKNLVNHSIKELQQTKESGYYCDEGYELDGDICKKEVKYEAPILGLICKEGYHEVDGICYEETPSIVGEQEICRENMTKVGNDCVEVTSYLAEAVCHDNEEFRDNHCIGQKYIGDAYEYCRDPGRTLYEHKCLATKPTINGGCLGQDIIVNGNCVNIIDDYYLSEWMCPNNKTNSNPDGSLIFEDNKCYEEEYHEVKEYKCHDNDKLNGNMCEEKHIEKPFKEVTCREGSTLVDYNICINKNKTSEKVEGNVCKDESYRLKGNECIYYEIKDAYQTKKG